MSNIFSYHQLNMSKFMQNFLLRTNLKFKYSCNFSSLKRIIEISTAEIKNKKLRNAKKLTYQRRVTLTKIVFPIQRKICSYEAKKIKSILLGNLVLTPEAVFRPSIWKSNSCLQRFLRTDSLLGRGIGSIHHFVR